jgi:cytochrome oxidase Cu insertion factor (SCO1/SenC/PrrC family)
MLELNTQIHFMTISKKKIRIFILFLISILTIEIIVLYYLSNSFNNKRTQLLSSHIGEKFEIDNFIDIDGKSTKLDLKKSEVTIVDFWYNNCPSCIAEMKQFQSILNGNENSVSIISVSINNYSVWKNTLTSQNPHFSFLRHDISNWKHVALKSNEDANLANEIPGDNLVLLSKKYNTNSFPTYFVLNNQGLITATPFSAVHYIKSKVLHQSGFMIFLADKNTWRPEVYALTLIIVVIFSSVFWIVSRIIS